MNTTNQSQELDTFTGKGSWKRGALLEGAQAIFIDQPHLFPGHV